MALTPNQLKLINSLSSKGSGLKKPVYRLKKPVKPLNLGPMPPSRTDYALHTLGKGLNDLNVKALGSNIAESEEEMSVMSKLFDTLMIPNYTMANIASGFASEPQDDDGPLKTAWDIVANAGKSIAGGALRAADATILNPAEAVPFGLGDQLTEFLKDAENKLTPRKTFSDVLGDDLGVDNKWTKYGVGLGLDIATDPLTYLGGIGLLGKGKHAKDSVSSILDAKAAGLAKPGINAPNIKAPVAEDALLGNTIPNNMFGQLPKIPKVQVDEFLPDPAQFQPRSRKLRRRIETGKAAKAQELSPYVGKVPEVPSPARNIEQKMLRKQADFERKLTQAGKIADNPNQINMRGVTNIVDKIAKGELPYTLPKVAKATDPEDLKIALDSTNAMLKKALGTQAFNRLNLKQYAGAAGKLLPKFGPGQQTDLFTEIVTSLPKGQEGKAVSILRAAEDRLIAQGIDLVRNEGVRTRLSDVIVDVGDKASIADVLGAFKSKNLDKVHPAVRESIQKVVAYRSMATADLIGSLTKRAVAAKGDVTANYVGKSKKAGLDNLVKESLAQGKKFGNLTKKEQRSLTSIIKDVVNVNKLPADKWFEKAHDEVLQAVKDGRATPELLKEFDMQVAKTLGHMPDNLMSRVSGSGPIDYLMVRFTTWWGKGDGIKEAQSLVGWAERNAKLRSEMLGKLKKDFTADELRDAWKIVTGADSTVVSNPRLDHVATFMKRHLEELLKVPQYGTKMDNAAIKHLSVGEKSMMLMDDINRHLDDLGVKSFKFTRDRFARDWKGNKRDYSNGNDWMQSWDRYSFDDPVKMLYDIDLAMERATKEYAFLDSFAGAFGTLKKTGTHTYESPLTRLRGFYFEPEVGKQLTRIMNDLHKGSWRPNSPVTRYYVKGLRVWKTGVTIYLPSHHIRNAIGDINLMWLAGHNTITPFIRARRVMHSQRTRYKNSINKGDYDTLNQLVDPQAAEWAKTTGSNIIINKNGVKVNADEIFVGAHQRGLLRDANLLEDVFGESRIGFTPFKGKVHDTASGAAEYREHYIRLSHFIAATEKNLKRTKDVKKAMDDAAYEVRKWHPDGIDLTYFEQKYMRTVMPFYSWLRKSTPLLIESLVQRPSKALAYPRGMVLAQNLLGIEDATVADPFPSDQAFPEWIKAYGIGPIGDPESDNSISAWWGNLGRNMVNYQGDKYGYTVVNPSLPLIDFVQQFGDHGGNAPLEGAFDSTSPAIKVPFELSRGRDFVGAPIFKDEGGRGILHYLSKQLPATGPIQRITDWGNKDREGAEGGLDTEALINLMTALGIHGSGPYIKTAEFEQKTKRKALEGE